MFWNKKRKVEQEQRTIELIKREINNQHNQKEVNMAEEFEEDYPVEDEEVADEVDEQRPVIKKTKPVPKALPKLQNAPIKEKPAEERFVSFIQQERLGVLDKQTNTLYDDLSWRVMITNKIDRILRAIEG